MIQFRLYILCLLFIQSRSFFVIFWYSGFGLKCGHGVNEGEE